MAMDWESPYLLLLMLPALVLLLWAENKSAHPMTAQRKRVLLVMRALVVMLLVIALAGPAKVITTSQRAVVFALDESQSLGEEGVKAGRARIQEMRSALSADVEVALVGFGDEAHLIQGGEKDADLSAIIKNRGLQSNYAAALDYAQALFPAGSSRHVVFVGDGLETRGSLLEASRHAASAGIRVHAVGVAGPKKPDVRVTQILPNQSRIHEGAALRLDVEIQSTLDGSGVLKLFENGIEVEKRQLAVASGQTLTESFTRHPDARNIYKYRAVIEGFKEDSIPGNNEALALVDVRGRLRLLCIDGEPGEAGLLIQAMKQEGIEVELRSAGNLPTSAQELGGYDGIILSDAPAHKLGEPVMVAIRDYVDKLGGGFIMLGGPNSFGVGGYYRSPIEDILPVRLRSPDEEEKLSSALALLIDRSGSMAGEKLEMAKSASIATAEVLSRNDFLGVYAFDSEAHVVAPMTRLSSTSAVAGQIAGLTAGGGTNMYPAMIEARTALQRVKAKIKHMIILTDGETAGTGYEQLASQCRGEGITISTVGIGGDVRIAFLQAVASLGGGQSYSTMDASNITRIFTQDTLVHTGRMLREEPFKPIMAERSAMLAGWEKFDSPPLLGFVKTLRKTTAQVSLTTDSGEPLLAHWRYGLGKATAFTSDAKSRWASLWISRWSGFGPFWAQVLRETARPPQGQGMDLRIAMQGDEAMIGADVLADAGTRGNDERVTAEVFFAPVDSLAAPMKPVRTMALRQTGPGLYEGAFKPTAAGVYLVRAQSGSKMVTAGIVNNPSAEASFGTVNEKLLREACRLTGGTFLEKGSRLDLGNAMGKLHVELWPYFVIAALLIFILDIGVRRWEHVTGLWEALLPRK
jgi:Ca-activated chloride channel homolog